MNVLKSLDLHNQRFPVLQLVLVPLGILLRPSEQSPAPNTKSL